MIPGEVSPHDVSEVIAEILRRARRRFSAARGHRPCRSCAWRVEQPRCRAGHGSCGDRNTVRDETFQTERDLADGVIRQQPGHSVENFGPYPLELPLPARVANLDRETSLSQTCWLRHDLQMW